jgi:hypothetical protein
MKPTITARVALVAGAAVAPAAALAADGFGTYPPPKLEASNYVRTVDNPYFPLKPGMRWVYTGVKDGKPGRDVVQVTHKTRKILGVAATAIRDRLIQHGKVAESTTDWYAQDKRGDVVYLGEATRSLDKHGKLTDTSGSWLAGRRGAQPGIFMPAHPKVGQSFRQEFLKGQAEDHFKVVSKRGRTLKTRETTPLEPGVVDAKVYKRGIGTVKETTVRGGTEHFELVSFKR